MHTRSETITPPPAYSDVARQVLLIATSGRKAGLDQETIRCMLHAFAQAVNAAPQGQGLAPRPY